MERIARGEGLVANSALVLLFRMQEEIGNVIDGLRPIVVVVVVFLLGVSVFSERSPEEQVVPSTFDSLRRLVPVDGGLIVR